MIQTDNLEETRSVFSRAHDTRDIRQFLSLIFPPEWSSIAARIVESGAEFADHPCKWAARWSKIPPTTKKGSTDLEGMVKACIYRSHDCIHQLWGLPVPSDRLDDNDFYLFKRANMCGEVAVLTLTEFVLCNNFYQRFPQIRDILYKRNALPMLDGPLKGKSWEQVAARLDGVLHKKIRPRWLREHPPSVAFADDYVPMLEWDREVVDSRWEIMKKYGWIPKGAPNSRYSADLDGLELTVWMVRDFFHLMDTDSGVDERLTEFNRSRRREIEFPEEWV